VQWSRVLRLVPAAVVAVAAACSAGDLVLPPAPDGASATALQSAVRVSWTPVAGADRYLLLASTSASLARETALLAIEDAVSPFDMTGLAAAPWYFRIVAVKDGFFSPASDVISATPLAVGTAGLVPLDAAAWVVTSGDPAAHFGFPAVGAGDIDADGFDDLLIGEMRSTSGGTAYLYRGGPDGLLATPAWVTLSTQTSANLGKGLSSPGDLDGDGFRDVLVGTSDWDAPSSSEGRAQIFPGTGDATLVSDTPIWSAESDQAFAYMGRFAQPAGDVDGDGFVDFAVDQHGYNGPSADEGRVCVWYGGIGPPSVAADWMDDSDQVDAFLGYAISPQPGDADGDGYDDLLTGSWQWDPPGKSEAGAAFLYRGGPAGLEGEPSWTAEGEDPGNNFGGSTSFAGDVNGDGFDDVLVGAYLFGMDDRGRAYLYLGGSGGPSTTAVWAFDGTSQERLGMGVGAAGDVNADGFDDILLGAYAADAGANDGGHVLLFLGGAGGPAATPSWEWFGTDVDGFAGGTVADAGDVNGDGSGDFAVGVVSFEGVIADNGKVHVFHGPPSEGPSVTLEGLTGSFVDPASDGVATCTWEWGDGTAADVITPCAPASAGAPPHAFAGSGNYVVRLRVVNDYGLAGEAFSTVSVP